MLLAWASRLQTLCALAVLAWLGAGLGIAAGDGFEPERARYASHPYTEAGAGRALVKSLPKEGARAVLLGSAPGGSGGGQDAIAQVREALAASGCEVREVGLEGLYAAAEGADVLCLLEARPECLDLDWPRLKLAMRGNLVVDFTTLAPDGAADAAGLETLNFGRPGWPAWLDPEFQRFAEHVDATIPRSAGILMVPSQAYRTTASRSRWFLQLNYALAPRRLFLWRPTEAGGFVMQYFRWVGAVNQARPWADCERVRTADRPLSRLDLSGSTPTRSLTAEEFAAAERVGAEWILFYSPHPDFRLVDWEILPLERVRTWNE
jgi:hypothetical protein